MEIERGYKQTEVGIIPEEWEVKSLGAIGNLTKGRGLLKEDIKISGSIPAIPYTSLYTDFSEVLDYNDIKWYIDDAAQAYVADEPCVLIASSSNMTENTGKASALTGTTPVAIGREVIVLKTRFSSSFISYLLGTPLYRKKTLSLARGTTIKHVYPATFLTYKISLPPLAEQLAIAEVLGNADGLIKSLERLIAKKRQIKQALMQELITGKRRLPGFEASVEYKQSDVGPIPADWNISTVGREFSIQLGKMIDAEKNSGTSRPYVGNRAVQWGAIDVAAIGEVRLTTSDLQRFRLRAGDLLVCEGGEVGRAAIWNAPIDECYFQKAIHRLRPLRDYRVRYMLNVLHLYATQGLLNNFVTQTSIAHLPKDKFELVPIPLPCAKEQEAIASMLACLDFEIEAWEAKLGKASQIKQGMMHNLLTGKVRLI